MRNPIRKWQEKRLAKKQQKEKEAAEKRSYSNSDWKDAKKGNMNGSIHTKFKGTEIRMSKDMF